MLSEASPSPEGLWQLFLHTVTPKLSAHVLETWLRPVHCAGFDGERLTLEVRDQFFCDWLADHYLTFVKRTFEEELLKRPIKVSLVVNGALAQPGPAAGAVTPCPELTQAASAPDAVAKTDAPSSGPSPRKTNTKPQPLHRPMAVGGKRPRQQTARGSKFTPDASMPGPSLNERYRFDTFVEGPSNQFALAACRAAAENPGRSYNPLFLFGGVGLGKTHLLSAIGHEIQRQRPDAHILYMSSEQFQNEVINAVLSSRLEEFRERYRSQGDVILIDDIQLIAGKERTQHEFFHIFNTLYDSHRQIVVTSDKLPHEIPDIEERLRNRFQWGLIADVQPPEVETRIAILQQKAALESFEMSSDVAFFLARSIRSNVRELEGALVRIMAHASLTKRPLTTDYVRTILTDILQHSLSDVTPETILKVVADRFGLRVGDLKGSCKKKEVVRPRQIAMFLCRKHLRASYPEIGARFGNKNHTTVMAAFERIQDAQLEDQALREQLEDIEQRLDRSMND